MGVEEGTDDGGKADGDGDGDKPGERGMMVAMGHGLCVSFWVSGEMMKNKVGPKKCNGSWSIDCGRLARGTLANKWR